MLYFMSLWDVFWMLMIWYCKMHPHPNSLLPLEWHYMFMPIVRGCLHSCKS